MGRKTFLILLGLWISPPVDAAVVIDGDSLIVEGEEIRLMGIDAPEIRQKCKLNGESWKCGFAAQDALFRMIQGRKVHCIHHKRDRYKRRLSTCYADDINLNAEMVRSGYAVTYRNMEDYLPEQDEAKKRDAGIWSSEFLMPWKWRKQRRDTSQ